MAKPPDLASLRPFLAPMLLRRPPGVRSDRFLPKLASDVVALVAADARNGPTESSSTLTVDGLRLRTIEYVEARSPAWAPDSLRIDVVHHLAIVATKGDLGAVCASQGGFLDRLAASGRASPIDRSTMERAFVGSKASVIWMSGIHERTDAKPTAKTLMGSALEYALDPLGDQSFLYSAMRSQIDVKLDGRRNASIGASPGSSRIWTGRAGGWAEFARRLELLLDRAKSPPAPSGRFGALARGMTDLIGVEDAYEVGLVPPELLADLTDPDAVEGLESWVYETEIDVLSSAGPDVVARVVRLGVDLGDVAIRPVMIDGRVEIGAVWTTVRGGSPGERDELVEHLRAGRWPRIRYGSGHTISHGGCYANAHREERFDWTFVDLTGYSVTDEKPSVSAGQTLANRIGSTVPGAVDDSLFGYVFHLLGGDGWLASDDGSMEIADFIHIARDDRVTLVHVKPAGSASPARQTSASKYEVVVGQAVKNLRHLDRTTLADALRRNRFNSIGSAVWLDGTRRRNRAGMIRRARRLPPGYARRVVILQPQLTETEHDLCNSGGTTPDRMLRMKQLHTLMLAARLSAGAVGATLEGWGAK